MPMQERSTGIPQPVLSSARESAARFSVRPQDFWMLILGGKTDARLARLRANLGDRAAFEAIYAESGDPWYSVNPCFTYQRRKYAAMMALLPAGRQFARALDLGCGLGTLSRLLADRADTVLGLDCAETAVGLARGRNAGISNLEFACGDILDLAPELAGQFDLILIADTLYYLPSTSDAALDEAARRIAMLLAPGGLCMVSNHLFPLAWDGASRLSRRIHRSFCRSPRWRLVSRHWRPFFLTTLLAGAPVSSPA